MWCMWWQGIENKCGYREGGRGFHCLPLIGQAWRHSPRRLPPPSILLSPPLSSHLPPSVFTSLPCLTATIHITTEAWAIALAFWTCRRKLYFCGGFLMFVFSCLHFYLLWMPSWTFSLSVFVLPLLYLLHLYLHLLLLCFAWLYISLSTTRTSAMELPLLTISC